MNIIVLFVNSISVSIAHNDHTLIVTANNYCILIVPTITITLIRSKSVRAFIFHIIVQLQLLWTEYNSLTLNINTHEI